MNIYTQISIILLKNFWKQSLIKNVLCLKIFIEPCIIKYCSLARSTGKRIMLRCPSVICGYCKLLRTDMKRKVQKNRNQNEHLLLFLGIREFQVSWECANTRKRKFFKQMWNLSSLWGASLLIKRSVESQLKWSQDIRNINRKWVFNKRSLKR